MALLVLHRSSSAPAPDNKITNPRITPPPPPLANATNSECKTLELRMTIIITRNLINQLNLWNLDLIGSIIFNFKDIMCEGLKSEIVPVQPPMGIVLLILNILIPGLGTFINAFMGENCNATTAIVGVL